MPNWKLSNITFKDGRRNLVAYESKAKGNYTVDEIMKIGQKESNSLAKTNKGAQIGIAYHFKDANVWMPATMTTAGSPFEVFDITYNNAYEDDDIDAIYFTVIREDVANPVKYLKPNTGNKAEKNDKRVNKSLFDKK